MVGERFIMDRIFNVECPRVFLPKQLEVLEAINKYLAVLYSGAFRAGKTLLLVNAGIQVSLENPGCAGMLVSQTGPQLKSVVFDLFEKEVEVYQEKLRKEDIDFKILKNIWRSYGSMKAEFYNGSTVYFRSADDQRKLAGYTLDWFGMDEPVDINEDVFLQLMGRISGTGNLKNRFCLLTTNPGSELHWLYKYFYLKKDPQYLHVDTTTYDNILLPDYDNYIKEKEKLWDKDWIRRYLNGKWGMFEGAIYKTFNPSKHVGDFKDIPCAYYIAGVDWGLRNPYAVLIIGITNDKRVVVKKEIYGNDLSSHELAKVLQELHKDWNFRKVYSDPSNPDLIKQAYELGVPIDKGDNDVDSGISKVNSIFKANKALIDKSCIWFIKEHQAYRFETGKEKPLKENDHTCDAFKYGLTNYKPFYRPTKFTGGAWSKITFLDRWRNK